MELHITSEALDYVVRVALDRNQGARPVRQLVTRYVDEPLAEKLVKGSASGRVFELRVDDGAPFLLEIETATSGDAEAAPVG